MAVSGNLPPTEQPRLRYGTIPAPGIVPRADYPTVASPLADVRFFLNTGIGSGEVELTHLVKSAQWRFGQRIVNRLGGVMRPADGVLVLDNRDGQFSTFNVTNEYIPLPSSRVRITYRGETAFTGWTSGTEEAINTAGEDVANMRLYGSLQRLEDYGQGLFARLSGVQTTDQVFRTVMQAAEERYQLQIDSPSGIRVYGSRINREGALGSGRRLASFQDALRMLALVEGGRIYDDSDGTIHFEGFAHRLGRSGRIKNITVDDVNNVTTHALDDYVINVLESESGVLRSQGFKPLEFTKELPDTVIVPGQSTFGIVYEIADDDIVLIENWEPLVRGDNYDYGIQGVTPDVEFTDTSITIIVNNPTNSEVEFTLHSLRGEPFEPAVSSRLYLRSEASIARYGVKAAVYPAQLVENLPVLRGYLERYLQDFDGINSDGTPTPPKSIDIRIRAPETTYEISDLVLVSYNTPWKVDTNAYPFWVEAVDYSMGTDGVLDVTLSLLDAWRGDVERRETLGDRVGTLLLPNENIHIERNVGTVTLEQVEHNIGRVPLYEAVEASIGDLKLPGPEGIPEMQIGDVFLPPPQERFVDDIGYPHTCLLYTSPSPRDS